MTLLNLICNFYNFQPPENSNSSFWEGLFGALIGAAAALTVFYLETNREKKKDTRIKAESEANSLVYFSSLIQSTIAQSEKQIIAYKEHSEKIVNQPFDFHSLHIIVTEDLNRVVNKFDHERIFHSYLSRFGNSIDNIKKFQKIYSRLDSILKLYELANFAQEAYIKELLDRLSRYKDISEEKVLNYCSLLLNVIKNTNKDYNNNPLFMLLNNALTSYEDNAPKPKNVTYLQTHFIDVIKTPLVQSFRHIEEALYIIDNCRKATWLYNETIERTKINSETFQYFSSELKKVSDSLKELTEDLKI